MRTNSHFIKAMAVLFLFAARVAFSDSLQVVFDSTYGISSQTERCYGLETLNGNLLAFGSAYDASWNLSARSILIDGDGNRLWSNTLDGTKQEEIMGASSRYLVATSNSFSTSNAILLMKINPTTGDTIWSRLIKDSTGALGNISLQSYCVSQYGKYVTVGAGRGTFIPDSSAALVLCYDTNGTQLWTKLFYIDPRYPLLTKMKRALSCVASHNSFKQVTGFYVSCYNATEDTGSLLYLDTLGIIKTAPRYISATRCLKFAGLRLFGASGGAASISICDDGPGTAQKTGQYPIPNAAVSSLNMTSDSGWLVVGTSKETRPFMVKFDKDLQVEWAFCDSSRNATGTGGVELNGDFYLAGYTTVPGQLGSGDWFLTRLHFWSPGTDAEIKKGTGRITLSCFPNPFNINTTVKYYLPVSGNVFINVYDVLGKSVANQQRYLHLGEHQFILNGNILSFGTYFVNIRSNNKSNTIKINIAK